MIIIGYLIGAFVGGFLAGRLFESLMWRDYWKQSRADRTSLTTKTNSRS